MTDRRRAPRYVLETPLRGDAMPMQDAVVEELAGDRLVVISPSSRKPFEDVKVHLAMAGGVETHRAQVLSSTPVSLGGSMSFRLELRLK